MLRELSKFMKIRNIYDNELRTEGEDDSIYDRLSYKAALP